MGGAKNCPETPRQKMIGMMYLVLTAMLALNVSTDILQSFTVVDNSLHASIDGNNNRNGNLYYRFWKSSKREEVKVGPWYQKSQELKAEADKTFNFIQDFKEQIVRITDGDKAVDARKAADTKTQDGSRDIEGKDNRDAAGQYAIAEGHGEELRKVLDSYRDYLCQLTDTGEYGEQRRDEIKMLFNTDEVYSENEKRMIPWEVAMFEGMPTAAAIALLSKIQNDVRATEGQMIQYLYDRTDANDITVNRMSAYVIPKAIRVGVGEKYEAQLLLAGVDTLQTPEYYVNGQKISSDGLYTFTASGVGEHSYSGVIKYRNNAGEPVEAHFSQRYIVEEVMHDFKPEKQDKMTPNVAITNRDLSVVYQGYGHTFMVTSTTIPAAQLNMSASGASVSKISPGMFRVQATASPGSDITINVTGSYQGKTVSLGSEKFRVKRLPKPMPSLSVGGREFTGGKIARGQLLNSGANVVASYGEDALIKADFTVQSFQIYAQGKYLQSSGSHYSGEQLALLKTLSMGTPVMFLGIKAKGPGGVILDLRPISFVLN